MSDPKDAQLESLKRSMAVLESQRTTLGDDAVDPAISLLSSEIEALEARREGESDQPEDRRIVTIFFSDIVGSTQLAERLDPEDWRETVAAVHAMAGGAIRDHGGIVVQYLGDGLLALFGAQVAKERDPERAVRAALDIQANIDSIPSDRPIRLRVGIHTGLVVTGEMGSDAKREFTASGDSMNRASHLQSAAPPGGILISRATYRHVRGIFDFEVQPPIEVKGMADQLMNYRVLRAKTRPYKAVTRGVRGVETRTIGRDDERKQLLAQYHEALDTRGVVWAQLMGEPGVGKTRLLADIADHLEFSQENLRWLRACANEDDERQPFGLVRRMWFDHFQIAEDLPISEVEDRWFEGCIRLGGTGKDFEEAGEAFGLLVGLPFADRPAAASMRERPMQVKGRGFAVGRELVQLLRDTSPLVILIEDLQWADQSSWEYITEVLLHDPGKEAPNGLFILATARSEWDPHQDLLNFPGYKQIDLSPLSDSASRDLVAELLQRVDQIPEELVSSIVASAEGVPYYAEEIVNWFLDRGVIDRRFQPWRFVADRFDEAPLPETLQHLLFTRLNALGKAQQEFLQYGSIFGRSFWDGGLIALDLQSSDEMIGDLEQRGFIKEQPVSTFAGQREWSFHHDLMRVVAYESILKRTRSDLHGAAGVWLESQASVTGRLDEFAGRIGAHSELAGNSDAAVDWFMRAGESAGLQGAIIEARDFFNRTLELLPQTDRERRWNVLVLRDGVLSPLAENQQREEGIAALLDLAREFDDQNRLAEALYRQGVFLQGLGDYPKSAKSLESAVEFARETRNQRLEALTLALIALCQARLGELELAASAAEEALSLVERLGDDATLVRVLNNVAICFESLGDIAKAAILYARQVEVADRLGDIVNEAAGQGNLGYNYALMGMFEKSRDTLEKALRLNEAHGARRSAAYNLLNLALVYWRIGDARTAQQVLEKAFPILLAICDTFGLAIRPSYIALSHEHLGDLGEAMRFFDEAKLALEELGLHGLARDCIAGMARCALAQDSLEEAMQHASELWSQLEEHGASGMELPIRAYVTCAEVFEALGEGDQCRKVVEAGYSELMARADKIGDVEWCKRYLENVPEHRAIREMRDRRPG